VLPIAGLLRSGCGLRSADDFQGSHPFLRRRALNLTVPQALTGQLTATLSVCFRPAVERLAEVCKLPLTLSASQNPLTRPSPLFRHPVITAFESLRRCTLPRIGDDFRELALSSLGAELLDLAVSVGSDVVADDLPFG